MTETFRAIAEFPRYMVGDMGTVVSTVRSGRILRPTLGTHGYLYVSLMGDTARAAKRLVHRLVAAAFVENPCTYEVVNHKNGIKTDNEAVNLEWCSYAQNNEHARTFGLSLAFGETHYAAKLTSEIVAQIRGLAARGVYHRVIADRFGIGRQQITKIVNGQAWARSS